MRRLIWAMALLLIAAPTGLAQQPARQPAKEADLHTLMERKLDHAQQILAGLTTEDYAAIAKHARALNELTENRWIGGEGSDEYRAQLKTFRFTNSELIRLAEEKNLEGATLAYVQQTLSCVGCHTHLRSAK